MESTDSSRADASNADDCPLNTLPPEMVAYIMRYLGDKDFCACIVAARAFGTHTNDEYENRASRWRGCKTLEDFCAVGNLDALAAIIARSALPPYQGAELVRIAAKYDHAHIVEWLCGVNHGYANIVIDATCLGIKTLALLVRLYPDVVRSRAHYIVFMAIIYNGSLDSVKLMHEADMGGFHPSTLTRVASHARLDIVRFLCAHHTGLAATKALRAAASNGDMVMVKFLCQQPDDGATKYDKGLLDGAASLGRVDIMQILCARRPLARCTKNGIISAAMYAHLDAVVWLHQHKKSPCCRGIAELAHYHAHDDDAVTQWLTANGCACAAERDLDWFQGFTDSEVTQEVECHRREMARILAKRDSAPC